jgi:hypothetical protein
MQMCGNLPLDENRNSPGTSLKYGSCPCGIQVSAHCVLTQRGRDCRCRNALCGRAIVVFRQAAKLDQNAPSDLLSQMPVRRTPHQC